RKLARQLAADYRNGARVAGLAQPDRDFARARGGLGGKLLDNFAALENIAIARESRLVHQNLLRAQAERLLGLVGQGERLAKARQLECVHARVGRDDDRERLVRNADDINFGLPLGESERAHLASGAKGDVIDAVLGIAKLRQSLKYARILQISGTSSMPLLIKNEMRRTVCSNAAASSLGRIASRIS